MMCTPENLIVVLGGDELCEALRLFHRARAATREEWKHADLVGAAARLHLLFREADPGDLGRRVDDRGDRSCS